MLSVPDRARALERGGGGRYSFARRERREITLVFTDGLIALGLRDVE